MNRPVMKDRTVNQEEFAKQLNAIEIADRAAREAEFGKLKWQPRAINAEEDAVTKRVSNYNETSDQRQAELIKNLEREKKFVQKYENAWEKENRKTIEGIREVETNQAMTARLLREREKLLADYGKVAR